MCLKISYFLLLFKKNQNMQQKEQQSKPLIKLKEDHYSLCKKHQQEQHHHKQSNINITNELFKCKQCTKDYPIHINRSMDGEEKYKKSSERSNSYLLFTTPPPNITFSTVTC